MMAELGGPNHTLEGVRSLIFSQVMSESADMLMPLGHFLCRALPNLEELDMGGLQVRE